MQSALLTLVGVLAATAAAAPQGYPTGKVAVANFDDISDDLITGLSEVGTYQGLMYEAFNAAKKSPITGSTGGIVPHSGEQTIVGGIVSDLVQLGHITLNPFGDIVAEPSCSFDLYSFWFGCGLNAEQPLASIAGSCDLSVTGYTVEGEQVPVATYSYVPTDLLGASMIRADLPESYRNLKNVTLGVAAGIVLPATTALWLDDISYCNHA